MMHPTNKFEISVIVPTYNRSRLLEYTLRTLSLQNIARDRYEVVVSDDGSSDDTQEIVDRYREKMNVKYIYQEDKGYRVGSARNKAIGIAEGKLCLFIDSGILLNTDALEKHIGFHAKHGPYAAVVGYVYGFDREEEEALKLTEMIDPDDPAGSFKEVSKHEIFFDCREKQYQAHNDQIHLLPAAWLYFWGGHISASRESLIQVGMFDEAYDGL